MTRPTPRRPSNTWLFAGIVVTAMVVLALASFLTYYGPLGGQSSSVSGSANSIVGETSSVSSISPKSSVYVGGSSKETTKLDFLYPCNCSYNLGWAWPAYNTLSELKSASGTIVVAEITSTRTLGVNISYFPSPVYPAPRSPIPVTAYNITITTVLFGGPDLKPGVDLTVAQIGGAANGTTMSIVGYPTLSVGLSYIFFLSPSSDVLGAVSELATLYDAVSPSFTLITTAGPQGLFYVQGGMVYSLDNMYPQDDAWLPVKADGVPLAQFILEVQNASTTSTSALIR
jgi:hypothetical protein